MQALEGATALDIVRARARHAAWLQAARPRFLAPVEAAGEGWVRIQAARHPLLLQPSLAPLPRQPPPPSSPPCSALHAARHQAHARHAARPAAGRLRRSPACLDCFLGLHGAAGSSSCPGSMTHRQHACPAVEWLHAWRCRSPALAMDTDVMPTRLAVALEKDSSASARRSDDAQGQGAAQRSAPPRPLQLTAPPGCKVAAITGPNTGAPPLTAGASMTCCPCKRTDVCRCEWQSALAPPEACMAAAGGCSACARVLCSALPLLCFNSETQTGQCMNESELWMGAQMAGPSPAARLS